MKAAPAEEESAELSETELLKARERLAKQFARTEGPVTSQVPQGEEGDADPLWAVQEFEFAKDGGPKVGTVLLAHPEPYRAILEAPDTKEPEPVLRLKVKTTEAEDEESEDVALENVVPPGPPPAASLRTGFRPRPTSADRWKLPVVVIVKRSKEGTEGLLLGFWTGHLLGDLNCEVFKTRPLYCGGQEDCNVTVLHPYPDVTDSRRITSDGLMLSYDFWAAADYANKGPGSPLRCKTFFNQVRWRPDEETELRPESGVWLHARCSRDLLLREPDSSKEEPLWAQIVRKVGGDFKVLACSLGLSHEEGQE